MSAPAVDERKEIDPAPWRFLFEILLIDLGLVAFRNCSEFAQESLENLWGLVQELLGDRSVIVGNLLGIVPWIVQASFEIRPVAIFI